MDAITYFVSLQAIASFVASVVIYRAYTKPFSKDQT